MLKLTLRELRKELRKLVDAGLIPKSDIDEFFHKLGDWRGSGSTNWQVDVRATEPAKPTERAALLRYDTGRDGKLRRLSDSTDNALDLLAAGVTTVKHGLKVIRDALKQLEPMSSEAAQAALEETARAANRCILGCYVSHVGEDRLKRGLCPKHHRAQCRAEEKERHRRAESDEVVTGTDGP